MKIYISLSAIVNPPLNLKLYVRNRIKTLQAFYDRTKDYDSILGDIANDGNVPDLNLDIYKMQYCYNTLAKGLKYILYPLKDVKSYSDKGSITSVITGCQLIEKQVEHLREAVQSFDDQYKRDYEYLKTEYSGNELAQITGLYKIASEFKSIPIIIDTVLDIRAKFTAALKLLEGNQLSTESIETLYHATAFAPELVKEGFKKVCPADRYGLGSYGVQKTVSFTHDVSLAKSIVRCFRECIMLLNGDLKPSTVINWLLKDSKEKTSLKGIIDALYQNCGIVNGVPKNDEQLLGLYNYYLWNNKLRENPFFADTSTLAKSLKGRNVKDVGIVACKVIMEGSEYLISEREYRVLPEKILSVKRYL